MYCEKCGAQIEDDARFCPSCGNKISNEFPVKMECTNNTVIKEKSNKLDNSQLLIRVISSIVIILSVSVIALTSVVRYVVKSPEDTVAEYFYALGECDVDGILNTLDPATAKRYKTAVNLLGGITGLGIDTDFISSMGGVLSDYTGFGTQVMDVETVYYRDGEVIKESSELNKLTATDAEVTFTYVIGDNAPSTDVFPLHNYNGKWKIEGEYHK